MITYKWEGLRVYMFMLLNINMGSKTVLQQRLHRKVYKVYGYVHSLKGQSLTYINNI